MDGNVKWFSRDKGYGFLTGEDGVDRFFGHRDIDPDYYPQGDDRVEFEEYEGKKGPAARSVKQIAD